MKVVGYVVEEADGTQAVYEKGPCAADVEDLTKFVGKIVLYKGAPYELGLDGDGDPAILHEEEGEIWLQDSLSIGQEDSYAGEADYTHITVRRESLQELEARMVKAWE